jgi:hypothetical protein
MAPQNQDRLLGWVDWCVAEAARPDAPKPRLRNNQSSGSSKVQIGLIDYLFRPSSFLYKFNSYIDR